MFELINKVKEKYPNDHFFDEIKDFLKEPTAASQYKAYETALSYLDENSLKIMIDKALIAFKSNYKPKRVSGDQSGEKINKRSFFDHLNEVFGYQFLVQKGYENVRLLAEDKNKKNKTPDLEYEKNGIKYYCDVKTINRSDDDIERFRCRKVFSALVYEELSSPFLTKISSAIQSASDQIKSKNTAGMVFLFINFDDFTLAHYQRYKEQIIELLLSQTMPEIYIKVHLTANKWIHKKDNLITSS